jgi:heme/copper-type cytochrome/quinol oxidase subunit 2
MAALALLIVPLPTRVEATTRHLTIDAAQYEFAPGRVHVNQGDRVVITVTASDVVHGFHLDGYALERRVTPGVAERIEFVAEKAGKFRYRCAVSCGPLHPFMIGELVVAGNTPYWRALGFVLVASAGMLAHLWQTGRNNASDDLKENSNGTYH